MSRRPPKAQGELAELVFMCRAASEGLVVAKPWGDNLPFDFLVGRGTRWWRVQVKSTRKRSHRSYQAILCHSLRYRGYTAADTDFIAAYVIPAKAWYIVPIKECTRKLVIGLFPTQVPAKRSAGRFEKYREAWRLLRGQPAIQARPARVGLPRSGS